MFFTHFTIVNIARQNCEFVEKHYPHNSTLTKILLDVLCEYSGFIEGWFSLQSIILGVIKGHFQVKNSHFEAEEGGKEGGKEGEEHARVWELPLAMPGANKAQAWWNRTRVTQTVLGENKKGLTCNLVDTSKIRPVMMENGHVKQALSIIRSHYSKLIDTRQMNTRKLTNKFIKMRVMIIKKTIKINHATSGTSWSGELNKSSKSNSPIIITAVFTIARLGSPNPRTLCCERDNLCEYWMIMEDVWRGHGVAFFERDRISSFRNGFYFRHNPSWFSP